MTVYRRIGYYESFLNGSDAITSETQTEKELQPITLCNQCTSENPGDVDMTSFEPALASELIGELEARYRQPTKVGKTKSRLAIDDGIYDRLMTYAEDGDKDLKTAGHELLDEALRHRGY